MKYSDFMKSRGMVNRSSVKPKDDQKPKDDDLINDELDIKEKEGGLSSLSKADLLKFAGKKKLYDKSFKGREPAAIIPVVLEKARAIVVEAGLKTADEAASLTEDELFALFDTVGK
jgi:hypothetical protein